MTVTTRLRTRGSAPGIHTPHQAHAARQPGHIRIDGVSIVYGPDRSPHVAVRETDLTVEPGQFVCLLGPSGCGKSTLLNTVAGYITPSSGRVLVDGTAVTRPGPERGMVFQQYSLFPWKTVRDNIAFGPRIAGRPQAECRATADKFLAMVGLSHIADKHPGELSGGMQQRVGIARALAITPRYCSWTNRSGRSTRRPVR